MDPDDQLVLGLLELDRVVPLGEDQFDVRVLDILDLDELALDPDLVPVSGLADVRTVKVGVEVSIGHPEGPIPDVKLRFDLGLQVLGPQLRLPTPITLPLEACPWPSELDQPEGSALVGGCLRDSDHRVRVARY